MIAPVAELEKCLAKLPGFGRRSASRAALALVREPARLAEPLVAALRAEPMLVARLLTDDLPLEVEAIFRREGFDLFPGGKIAERVYDVTTKCSCPDWANPCKHSLAVLFILGEECAWRPATLLELRGITMEELCDED